MTSKILLVRRRLATVLSRSRLETQAALLAACCAMLVACGGGGGGGGGGGNNPPPTGTLEATVVDEFGTPVNGATVAATVSGTKKSGTTNASGVATVGNVPVGTANVDVSLQSFQSATATADITEGGTTQIEVTLLRNRQAAGGVLTTSVVGTPSPDGSSMTIRVRVVVVDDSSKAIENLTAADFQLNDCTAGGDVECVRFDGTPGTLGYTVVDTAPTCAPGSTSPNCTVAGQPRTPQAAALLLDQSGSVGNISDPTGARLFSAKEFLKTVTASGDDFVLLSAFAADRTSPDQTALIPDQPLTVYNNGTFTKDGQSFFGDLDDLASQAGGGTPLYRSLFPEDTDGAHAQDPNFTTGMIDIVADAPEVSGLPKSIVVFTDGEDEECGTVGDQCPDKRARVIQHALDRGVRIFTIGLSNQVNFLALGELASKTGGVALFAETAEQLIPLYGSLGALLSDSLLTYEMEWTINSDPGTFQSGQSVTILGRVEVNAAGTTVQVPFIVGIP